MAIQGSFSEFSVTSKNNKDNGKVAHVDLACVKRALN